MTLMFKDELILKHKDVSKRFLMLQMTHALELMLKHKDVSKRFLMLQLIHVLNVIVSREQFDY